MARNEPLSRSEDYADRRLRLALTHQPENEPRTIVIRQGSAWQSLAFLFLCLLLIAVVLLGQFVLRGLDAQDQQTSAALARTERKLQQLEAGMSFDGSRRQLLLGMRDHILKVNAKASLADAYLYAGSRSRRARSTRRSTRCCCSPSAPSRAATTRRPRATPTRAGSTRSGPRPAGCSRARSAGTTTKGRSTTRRRTPRRRRSTSTSCSPPTTTRTWCSPSTTAGR